MAISDLDTPASVSLSTAVKYPPGPLRLCVPVFLVFCFAAVGAASSFAQDQQGQDQQSQNEKVAEAARQERARKQAQQTKPKHVYTAEDLKREHILTPEDRAAVEARKNQPAALPGAPKSQDAVDGSAVANDTNTQSPSANAPLGDVARRLRKQKESEKLQRSAEFHLPFADAPVLASPKPPAQPLLPSDAVRPPAPPANSTPFVAAPSRPLVKRSPFERPRNLPPAPAVPRVIVPVPAPLAPGAMPTPPRARVAPSPMASAKLIIITVKPGDSLWKFAAERLGDGHRWQELLSLNPSLRNPDVIQAGSQILLPASITPKPLRAPVKYTARSGDTLWTLAQSHFGRGTSWSCIAHANPDLQDANLIHEGQVLLLPASCKP